MVQGVENSDWSKLVLLLRYCYCFKTFCMPRMEEKRDRKKDVKAEVSTVVKEYFWDVRK